MAVLRASWRRDSAEVAVFQLGLRLLVSKCPGLSCLPRCSFMATKEVLVGKVHSGLVGPGLLLQDVHQGAETRVQVCEVFAPCRARFFSGEERCDVAGTGRPVLPIRLV